MSENRWPPQVLVDEIVTLWNSAATQNVGAEPAIVCRSAIIVDGNPGRTRYCYVSAASSIESLLAPEARLQDHTSHGRLPIRSLTDRLLGGEVSAVVTKGKMLPNDIPVDLDRSFVEYRTQLRQSLVQLRFLLRQIGLEEVSVLRGASPYLFQRVKELWCTELAVCLDVAMLLSAGADRQRYVDTLFATRAKHRLTAAFERLDGLGIQSYPKIVVV